MLLPIIGRVSGRSFLIGGVAATVAAAIARPLLVGTLRAAYEITDLAADAWSRAKAEVESAKREAHGKKPA